MQLQQKNEKKIQGKGRLIESQYLNYWTYEVPVKKIQAQIYKYL